MSATRARLHPATVLVTAICVWFLVIALNNPWASVGVVLAATAIAASWAARATILVLTLPVLLSMILIYSPHGEHRIAPLLTSDGAMTALLLTVRFMALIACVVAAMSRLKVVDLVKWVQVSRAGHTVAYIVGSALQFLPQGTAAVRRVSDARKLSSGDATSRRRYMVMPVISRLLSQGVQRGHSLAAVGFDRPGRRTLLRPVPDSSGQRAYRWAVIVVTFVIVMGGVLWG